MTPTGLSDDDLLSVWIGRVTQLDSIIESYLHYSFVSLVGVEGFGAAIVPPMTESKLSGISKMLKVSGRADVPDCEAAIKVIRVARKRRNAVVHGDWIRPDDAVTAYAAREPYVDPAQHKIVWSLSEFQACFDELRIAYVAAVGLSMALATRPGEGVLDDDSLRRVQREMMRGAILVPEGDYRLTAGHIPFSFANPDFLIYLRNPAPDDGGGKGEAESIA